MSQTIDQVSAIKTHTGSSKSELFSGTSGHFKVWKFLAVRTVVGENILEVCYVYFDLNFTSILRLFRPQLYAYFDLNFTSISTSTLRLFRLQLYIYFTSISTSTLRLFLSQLYVYFHLNFTSISISTLRLFRPQLYV